MNPNSSSPLDSSSVETNTKATAHVFNSVFGPPPGFILQRNIPATSDTVFKAGSLIQDGAPYSAFGEFELQLLYTRFPVPSCDLEPKPK